LHCEGCFHANIIATKSHLRSMHAGAPGVKRSAPNVRQLLLCGNTDSQDARVVTFERISHLPGRFCRKVLVLTGISV
jgi:hypothetical protein